MTVDESEIRLNDEKMLKINGIEKENVLQPVKMKIKIYRRRWFILALFILLSSLDSAQGTHYLIISNILAEFYNVTVFDINWTSGMTRFFLLIFTFPMTYMEEKIGLRRTMIIAGALCCLGSWIKIFSATPDGLTITFISHSFVSLSNVMVLLLPTRVCATWFGSNELSTVTMFTVFAPQFGASTTYLVTPIIVKKHNIEETGTELYYLFLFFAVYSSIIFIICIFFFQDEPKLPPSETRALQKINRIENKEGFFVPMKRLLTNRSYLVFCNTFGVNVGTFDTVCALLNPLIIKHFEDGEEDAGRIGMIIMFTGLFGSILFGRILDKTHKFKETTVTVYFLTFCSQVLFSIAIFMEIMWLIYVSAISLGFFMAGYLSLGFDVGVEFTYPESEAYSSGILNIFSIVYGIALLFLFGVILENYGDVPVHIILCIILLLGTIVSAMTKDVQNRQDARKAAICQTVPKDEETSQKAQLFIPTEYKNL